MAIPSVPTNFNIQQGNQQVYLSWDLNTLATSYSVQRSLDGLTYTTVASPTTPNYLDTAVTIGTLYYYQVAATNGSGTSAYTTPQSIVPTPTAEMSLGQLRLASQQRADRVNSQFVTLTEWNSYINQSMYELYDLLVDAYEDYFLAPAVTFPIVNNQNTYPLPDGILYSGAAPFYKMSGMDLALSTGQNAYVTINKFNFIDRNNYVYPNSNSTIYGVFNLQYRVMGSNVQFIPTPAGNQVIRMWYIPRLPQLLKDNDLTTIGTSGWLEYVIIRSAILALTKEESDTTALSAALIDLRHRIENSAQNRDNGVPDTISNTNIWGNWGGDGPFSGFHGGGF
jgi:hypothetical protein